MPAKLFSRAQDALTVFSLVWTDTLICFTRIRDVLSLLGISGQPLILRYTATCRLICIEGFSATNILFRSGSHDPQVHTLRDVACAANMLYSIPTEHLSLDC